MKAPCWKGSAKKTGSNLFFDLPEGVDAILSLACGAGVQTMADIFKGIPVLPGLNTTFLGAQDQAGVFNEKCAGCGDCVLGLTGGVCPIARCAKSLMNGPCGGSAEGICEVNKTTECIWDTIVRKKIESGRLEDLIGMKPIKSWKTARDGGPRRSIREELLQGNV